MAATQMIDPIPQHSIFAPTNQRASTRGPATRVQFAASTRGWVVGLVIAISCVGFQFEAHAQKLDPTFAEISRFYPQDRQTERTIRRLSEQVEYVMSISEAELLDLVPTQAGLRRVTCPICSDAQSESNSLSWNPREKDRLTCDACTGSIPDRRFPRIGTTRAKAPSGKIVEYPFSTDSSGNKYYFDANMDWHARVYLQEKCFDLAVLYHLTQRKLFAHRAALILDRFAEVFPDYVYHFDYASRPARFFDGEVPPARFLPGFRTARWTDWAYQDVPTQLIFAYELIAQSGELEKLPRGGRRIVEDFFLPAARQVAANPETFDNMSPAVWEGLAAVGLVLREPVQLDELIDRLQRFLTTRFYYDGFWFEGTSSYHRQVQLGIDRLVALLERSKDMAAGQRKAEPLSVEEDANRRTTREISKRSRDAMRAFNNLRLPDGRSAAVHDTWATTRGKSLAESSHQLLGGLGHALLGRGRGPNQTQLHLTWSGGYGHHHYDALSLLLYAHGKELISDIGYTRTKDRAWSQTTAAHNTVVVDWANQPDGPDQPVTGHLRRFDATQPQVQLVAASSPESYRGRTQRYERMLASIEIDEENAYFVDVFSIDGAGTFDYFLHGSADELETCRRNDQPACDVQSDRSAVAQQKDRFALLPNGVRWRQPRNAHDLRSIRQPGVAYGFLEPVNIAGVEEDSVQVISFDSPTTETRMHLIAQAQDQLSTGYSPRARRSRDGSTLEGDRGRVFLMWRRENARNSRFIAVIEGARKGAPQISKVEVLHSGDDGLLLRIRGPRIDDLVAIEAERLKFIDDGRLLDADGNFSLIRKARSESFLYTTGTLANGRERIEAPRKFSAELLRVEETSDGGLFSVRASEGVALPRRGSVVIVEHADNTTHGYNVTNATRMRDEIVVSTTERPGFQLRKAGAVFSSFPQTTHPGPTRLTWAPTASLVANP